MKRILLTGKDGQVGFELQRALAPLGEIIALDRAECDLNDPQAVRALIRHVRPQIIVNPAAYTAVDKAESEPELAEAVNAVAPGVIGEEAAPLGALVVHYSTDYVFDGRKSGPYVETDATAPTGVYGRTKRDGEEALKASGARHLIFRTSWVFGAHGGNFVRTILHLGSGRETLNVVADQFGAPTSAALLADVTAHVLREERRGEIPLGLYHLTASGETCWCDYARYVVEKALNAGHRLKLTPDKIQAITTAEYPVPAARPANSRLNTEKLRQTFGIHLPDWRAGLDHVLAQIL